MSLILEALRKSEAERRRGEAPDLLRAEPVRAEAKRAIGAPWLLAGAALLGAAVLAWWQPRSREVASTQVAVAVPARETPAPARASAPARSTLPPVARLQPAPAPKPAPPAAPETMPPPQAPAGDPPTGPVPLGALSPEVRQSLPPLRLSMHLWNEDPARRSAILDGKRVAIGDRAGAAVVADIRRDGVLLQVDGRQVLVPLP